MENNNLVVEEKSNQNTLDYGHYLSKSENRFFNKYNLTGNFDIVQVILIIAGFIVLSGIHEMFLRPSLFVIFSFIFLTVVIAIKNHKLLEIEGKAKSSFDKAVTTKYGLDEITWNKKNSVVGELNVFHKDGEEVFAYVHLAEDCFTPILLDMDNVELPVTELSDVEEYTVTKDFTEIFDSTS